MMLKQHVMLSVLIFAALYAAGASPWYAAAAAVSSVAIDADHVLAFFFDRKKLPNDYAELKQWCRSVDMNGCVFLLFHNVWFIAITYGAATVAHQLTPVLAGVVLHYTADVVSDVYRYRKSRAVFSVRRWLF